LIQGASQGCRRCVQESSSYGNCRNNKMEQQMSIGLILLIILVLVLIGAFPAWPHSRGWGYGPSGGVSLIVVVLIVLLLMGRL
jgi:hypothetical protein